MAEYNARMGEIIFGRQNDKLIAYALGSCVSVIIYDKKKKIAVLSHVALPGAFYSNNKRGSTIIDAPGRYADTAIIECLRLLKIKGAKKQNLFAKITGGSRMFGTLGLLGSGLNIGDRNIRAIVENLKLHNIPIKSKDVGGNHSRTIKFNINNSSLNIKKGIEHYII